ncbi:hypothetical protein GY26_18180 [Gammaproteobacteria bacterium MFB021]|nr:hypothetical protein GY26_18180 [Gammaproteobacteria bacterium MFB021]
MVSCMSLPESDKYFRSDPSTLQEDQKIGNRELYQLFHPNIFEILLRTDARSAAPGPGYAAKSTIPAYQAVPKQCHTGMTDNQHQQGPAKPDMPLASLHHPRTLGASAVE